MAKHLKRPRDPIQLARLIGDIATGQVEDEKQSPQDIAASEWARRGGLKGGKARAEKLSAKRKTEIAKKAAAIRWGKAVEKD